MSRAWLLSLVLLGCEGSFDAPQGPTPSLPPSSTPGLPGETGPMTPDTPGLPPWGTPSVGMCVDRPAGLSYPGIDGRALDGDRLNIESTADRARLKSYDSLNEIRNEFNYGVNPATTVTNDALATFEAHATYEVPETQGGPLMIYSAFRYGYLGCLAALRTTVPSTAFGRHDDFKTSPTAESAQRQCQRFGVRYWKRELDAEELATCVDFALNGIAGETAPDRQWALVCGVMAATADNLTF